MNKLPLDIELIINKYIHELKTYDLRKEINKNLKIQIIYKLKWEGMKYKDAYEEYDEEYDKIMLDKNITSLYFRNKLEKILMDYY
jgi:hypothetical protein